MCPYITKTPRFYTGLHRYTLGYGLGVLLDTLILKRRIVNLSRSAQDPYMLATLRRQHSQAAACVATDLKLFYKFRLGVTQFILGFVLEQCRSNGIVH